MFIFIFSWAALATGQFANFMQSLSLKEFVESKNFATLCFYNKTIFYFDLKCSRNVQANCTWLTEQVQVGCPLY